MPNLALISDIIIPEDRQRSDRDPEKLQQLVESIQSQGLMHPPVLREIDGRLSLVAGHGRLLACTDLHVLYNGFLFEGHKVPEGYIPYTLLSARSDLEAKEAELAENLHREDLSWQDRVKALADLAELRRMTAERDGLPEPRMKDIASEISETTGLSQNRASEQLKDALTLSSYLKIPEVAKASTAKEARKIVKRLEENARHAEAAKTLGPALIASGHTVLNTDSLTWMLEAPEASFDIILTDPPYGMAADTFGDSGGANNSTTHAYKDDEAYFFQILEVLAPQSFRLARPDAHFYCFCDFDKFHTLKGAMESAGWKVFRTPLLWYKPHGARAPWPDRGPQRKYECILYAVKGNLTVNHVYGDVLEHGPDDQLNHSAQKPVSLYVDLLRRSARPGMRVLDPFCGTGPVFPAAQSLHCFATGIELDPASYSKASSRIQALNSTLELEV